MDSDHINEISLNNLNLNRLPFEIITIFKPILDEIENKNLILTKYEFIIKSKEVFKVSIHSLIKKINLQKLNPSEKQTILEYEQYKKSYENNLSFIPTITYNSKDILKDMLKKRFKDQILKKKVDTSNPFKRFELYSEYSSMRKRVLK